MKCLVVPCLSERLCCFWFVMLVIGWFYSFSIWRGGFVGIVGEAGCGCALAVEISV